MTRENVDMSSVLVMLLLAASKDKNHLFCALAKQNPQLLMDISSLRTKRNPVSHGDQVVLENITDQEIEKYWLIVQQIKEVIMPNINMVSSDTGQAAWQDSDSRLKARNQLEKYFGFVLLQRLNEDTCQSLQRALIFKEYENARLCVDELSSAMQSCLYQATTHLDILNKSGEEIKQLAIENLGQEFPGSLLKTRDDKVKNAAKGVNSTLGAIFIAFCARNEKSDLKYLAIQQENISIEIAGLIELRGHGGEILNQQARINKLADASFCIIKVLAEKYCD